MYQDTILGAAGLISEEKRPCPHVAYYLVWRQNNKPNKLSSILKHKCFERKERENKTKESGVPAMGRR